MENDDRRMPGIMLQQEDGMARQTEQEGEWVGVDRGRMAGERKGGRIIILEKTGQQQAEKTVLKEDGAYLGQGKGGVIRVG